MKKTLLLIVCLLVGLSINAQNRKIKAGLNYLQNNFNRN